MEAWKEDGPERNGKESIKEIRSLFPISNSYPFIMSDNEKTIFDQAIRNSHHYLEFGFGGSTLRAIQKSKATIYTVESSPEWIHYMRKYVFVRYFENNGHETGPSSYLFIDGRWIFLRGLEMIPEIITQ